MGDAGAVFFAFIMGAFVVFVSTEAVRNNETSMCERYLKVDKCVMKAMPADAL